MARQKKFSFQKVRNLINGGLAKAWLGRYKEAMADARRALSPARQGAMRSRRRRRRDCSRTWRAQPGPALPAG